MCELLACPFCGGEPVGWQWRHRDAGAPSWSNWKHVEEPIEEFLDLWQSQMQGNPNKAAAEVRPVFATPPCRSDAETSYVLMPREPTREMWAAGGTAACAKRGYHHDIVVEAIYRAMVAALSPDPGTVAGASAEDKNP